MRRRVRARRGRGVRRWQRRLGRRMFFGMRGRIVGHRRDRRARRCGRRGRRRRQRGRSRCGRRRRQRGRSDRRPSWRRQCWRRQRWHCWTRGRRHGRTRRHRRLRRLRYVGICRRRWFRSEPLPRRHRCHRRWRLWLPRRFAVHCASAHDAAGSLRRVVRGTSPAVPALSATYPLNPSGCSGPLPRVGRPLEPSNCQARTRNSGHGVLGIRPAGPSRRTATVDLLDQRHELVGHRW